MDDIARELQDSIQSTGDNLDNLNGGEESAVNCDGCDKLFTPKSSFITICEECIVAMEQNIEKYDSLKSKGAHDAENEADDLGLIF